MKKFARFNNHKGFTLIEVLVSLFCISLMSVLLVGCVQIMARLSSISYESEDRIACMQLRFMLAQSKDLVIEGNTLQFLFHNKSFSLQLHNKRLVKREGYEIFLKDLDTVRFEYSQSCVYMEWSRNHETKKALLTCE
ncbi:prepilin-type N-terminal cleavage/methylation domain-containing protein [Amedibacillus sp. YH-ame10]